jgi:hypothetical protein
MRWEPICVDDGNRDATWRALCTAAQRQEPHVKPLRLSRNYGQTAAMQAGIDTSRTFFESSGRPAYRLANDAELSGAWCRAVRS